MKHLKYARTNQATKKLPAIPVRDLILTKKIIHISTINDHSSFSLQDPSSHDTTIYLAKGDYSDIAQAIEESEILKHLECRINPAFSLQLCNALKENKSVRSLKISPPKLNTEPHFVINPLLDALGELLSVNNCLTRLDLSSEFYEKKNDLFLKFANGLKNNTTLKYLSIPDINYGVEDITPVIEAIKNHPELKPATTKFQLGPWKRQSEALALLIKENVIDELTITKYYFSSEQSTIPFFEALQENTSITDLRLACNLTAEEVNVFADALKLNHSLTKLDLNKNKLGSGHLSKILNSLLHHPSLTLLTFCDNNLTNNISPSIGSLIEMNSLTQLDLREIGITAEGCKFIGPALAKNKSITWLNLSKNPIELEGLKCLTKGLKHNKTLISLSLHDCGIDEEGCKYIGKALARNNGLLQLDISSSEININGYNALIKGLEQNTSLTYLHVIADRLVAKKRRDLVTKILAKNKQQRKDLIVNGITALIQIARSFSNSLFPLEIWLRIFEYLSCGAVPSFKYIAEKILMDADARDLKTLCKMKIGRINGNSHLI